MCADVLRAYDQFVFVYCQMRNATKNSAVLSRLKSVKRFSTEEDAPFPDAPEIVDDDGNPTFRDFMRSKEIDTADLAKDLEFWTGQR